MGLLHAPSSRLTLPLIIVLIVLVTSQNGECKRHNLLSVEINGSDDDFRPLPSRLKPSDDNDRPNSPPKSPPSNDDPNPPPQSPPSNNDPNPPPRPSPSNDPPNPPSQPPPSNDPPNPPSQPPPSNDPPNPPPQPPASNDPPPQSNNPPNPPLQSPSYGYDPPTTSFPPLSSPPSPSPTPQLSPTVTPSEAPSPTINPPLMSPPPPVVAPSPPLGVPPSPLLSPPSPSVPLVVPHPSMLSTPPSLSQPSPSPPNFSPSLPLSKPSPSPPSRPSSPNPHSWPPISYTPKLQVGFYQGKCFNKTTDVEAHISYIVEQQFLNDTSILPALLRLQFHDCFVHGCDASILIEGDSTERTAGPNLSVRGYELIDALKVSIEEECPGIVSCADIVAIATSVVIKLGGGPDYPAETGRRDGLVSKAEDVDLPSPTLTVPETIAVFQAKNFTPEEMVVLLGCHTVGIAHCETFQDRLYPDTNQFDPSMDPNLREQLKITCPQGETSNNFTLLNQTPQFSNKVDNTFYSQILEQRGILSIDQALTNDPLTHDAVVRLSLNATLFNVTLANAMVKLQAVDVLTGDQGEIRNVCSKFN